MDADFEGNGACARNREQRPDGEIEDAQKPDGKAWMHLFRDEFGVFPSLQGDCNDAHERETDACEQEPCHGGYDILPSGLPEGGRKNQIARAEKDGEHHQGDGKEVSGFPLIHRNTLFSKLFFRHDSLLYVKSKEISIRMI